MTEANWGATAGDGAVGVAGIQGAQERLREATTMGETLALGFEGFELIRILARACDGQVPELFATLMMTADAAVDGREAITCARSLPAGRVAVVPLAGFGVTDAAAAASVVAEFAALLSARLTAAAGQADLPEDRVACLEAAKAARRISSLTAPE